MYGSGAWDAMFWGLLHAVLCLDEGAYKIDEYPQGYQHLNEWRENLMQGKLKLSIEGMHCGGCVRRVKTALQGFKGVELGSS